MSKNRYSKGGWYTYRNYSERTEAYHCVEEQCERRHGTTKYLYWIIIGTAILRFRLSVHYPYFRLFPDYPYSRHRPPGCHAHRVGRHSRRKHIPISARDGTIQSSHVLQPPADKTSQGGAEQAVRKTEPTVFRESCFFFIPWCSGPSAARRCQNFRRRAAPLLAPISAKEKRNGRGRVVEGVA